jgi:hypothetical protein
MVLKVVAVTGHQRLATAARRETVVGMRSSQASALALALGAYTHWLIIV